MLKHIPFFLLLFIFVFPVQAQIYVDKNAGGADDGTSWADAYTSLQDALTDASAEIWVKEGTYLPPNNSGFELGNAVEIYGGFDGSETSRSERDPKANSTILSGDLDGNGDEFSEQSNNAYHLFKSSNDIIVKIDGFTLKGGNAAHGSAGEEEGGGIFWNSDDALTIRNCIFKYNQAKDGGGAVYATGSDLTIEKSIFINNKSVKLGGVVYVNSSTPLTINNCLLANNECINQTGGAIYTKSSSLDISLSTMVNNKANNKAGGIYAENTVSTLNSTIIWGNASTNDYGFIINNGDVTMDYCLIEDGTGSGVNIKGGATSSLSNNKSGNPKFVSPSGNAGIASGALSADWSIKETSAAKDAGDPGITGAPATDLAGNPRIYNSRIDIGAYEYYYKPSEPQFVSHPFTYNPKSLFYKYSIATSYKKSKTLNITCPTQPGWLSFTDNNDGTAKLSGTPTSTGTYNVTLKLDHTDISPVFQTFTITVTDPVYIDVPGDYSYIQDAINAASDGDVITIADGTYNEDLDTKNKKLVITSDYLRDENASHITNTIISGSGSSPVMKIKNSDHTRIAGLTIKNGGGRLVNLRTYSLFSPKAWYGGGIFALQSDLVLHDVNVKNCNVNTFDKTGGSGAGIYIGNNSDVHLYNSKVTNNQSDVYRGGGLAVDNSHVEIANTMVTDNETGHYGGALAATNSVVDIWKSDVKNNTCTAGGGEGGGVWLINSGLYIKENTITLNNSSKDGKDIYIFNTLYKQQGGNTISNAAID